MPPVRLNNIELLVNVPRSHHFPAGRFVTLGNQRTTDTSSWKVTEDPELIRRNMISALKRQAETERCAMSGRILILGITTLTLGGLITLAGVQFQNVFIMLIGTVVGGTGFGTVFTGTLRVVLAYAEPGERAGLLSAYFVVGYLAFSVAALAAGFLAPVIGLTRTADFYGAGVILLAISTLVVNWLLSRVSNVTCHG